MISVTGIYDGEKIIPTEAISNHRKYKVIITFVEEIDTDNADEAGIHNFGASASALSFWNSEDEDIYQDYLKKK